jgi:sulfate permease, SulP family
MFSTLRPAIADLNRFNYSLNAASKDIFAGIIVGIVALPLSIAFAIASGVKPEQGLITAVVAGFLISAFSGSRVQIGGPTGAFIIILAGIVTKHGYDGLAVATLIAGVLLIIMALAQLGDVIKFIPWPVTIGFTSGIAVVIFTTQVRDALGLSIASMPEHFLPKWVCFFRHLNTINLHAAGLMLTTILLVVYWPRVTRKVPGTIIAIIVTSVAAHLGQFPVETIGSRFGQIQTSLPMPRLPQIDWSTVGSLFSPALSIALLAGIESLLSAVVADGMTGFRHRSNAELLSQGIANIASPLFGGIPATGAIARTATNIKNGGRSPVAGIVHAITILIIFLFLGKQAALIPMATLAGILIVVAYNMSEYHLFCKMFRGPRSDVLVMLSTFLLTVLVDLTVAIEVGILLAMFLFMRRMISVTNARCLTDDMNSLNADDPDATSKKRIPQGVEVFEIDGPFFFGAAEKFKSVLHELKDQPKILILRMRHVPMMDATGMQALEEIITRHFRRNTAIILSGVQPHVAELLDKSGLTGKLGRDNVVSHIDQALAQAEKLLKKAAEQSPEILPQAS